MIHFLNQHKLVWTIPLAIALNYLAFENDAIFWYMYTFSILVLTSLALAFGQVDDELETWKALIAGLGYGTLLYAIIAGGFHALSFLPLGMEASVGRFLSAVGPTSIWHFLLLLFLIVPGEEIFWRGFVQQQMKQYMGTFTAILVTAVMFGAALAISGFWPGALAGIAAGLLLGALYEWKRSMPLIIITHIVMIILLFLVLPLPV